MLVSCGVRESESYMKRSFAIWPSTENNVLHQIKEQNMRTTDNYFGNKILVQNVVKQFE
jgi:hypothetical protein